MGEIKKEYTKNLVLLGNADGNYLFGQSDLKLVRKEVDRCLAEGMEGGGYMLSISGSARERVRIEALIEVCG